MEKENPMHWNYRILKRDGLYGIYEVYYDKSNKPIACDAFPILEDENLEDLQFILNEMLRAFGKEVLNYDDF